MTDRKSLVAIDRWVNLLAAGGVLAREGERRALEAPIQRRALEELEAWLGAQPREVRDRERRAAIEVCIWMANADRTLDPEEASLLKTIIDRSGLDDDVKDELVAAVHDVPSIADIDERLTNPTLRELLLHLAWELASADGTIARAEAALYVGLAKRLGVSEARAEELKRSSPPDADAS